MTGHAWGGNRVDYAEQRGPIGVTTDFRTADYLKLGSVPLFRVVGSDGQTMLEVARGSYMVVADGWRGRILRRAARLLYWRHALPDTCHAYGLIIGTEGDE